MEKNKDGKKNGILSKKENNSKYSVKYCKPEGKNRDMLLLLLQK